MPPVPEVRGWCPTAFQPMESGDGLLLRAKIIGARISCNQLKAIAHIASSFGNGLIDLSQRAQFQIRGVRPAMLQDAIGALKVAGLLTANAEIERIANILAPPLSGLDASAIINTDRLVADLATGLAQDAKLYALPGKFLFGLQDGGALPIDVSQADISICPATEGRLAVRVAGIDDKAAVVGSNDAIPVALRLAKAFIDLRAANPFDLRRMRKLIEDAGLSALVDKAGIVLDRFTPSQSITTTEFAGAHRACGCVFAGVAAPAGRWRAEELDILAEEAAIHGMNEARLTPWRALLFPTSDLELAIKIKARAQDIGLIVEAKDPRRYVAACPGAPECLQAQGDTRRHLDRLAPLASQYAGSDGVGLHISGCGKGCARRKSTPVTLVLDQGKFNLILNGVAQDRPTLTNLSCDEVERTLMYNPGMKAPCLAI